MNKIVLRKAEYKDWKVVLSLRNKNYVRRNSWNTDIIAEADHKKFFRENYHCFYMINDDQGYVRIRNNDVGIALFKKYQGKGLGTAVIRQIRKMFPGLRVEIRVDNVASLKCFQNAGYRIVGYLLE
jgi:RimJ/RimL family protein N-acetyltransferase